mgnify:CR=1 FL=1
MPLHDVTSIDRRSQEQQTAPRTRTENGTSQPREESSAVSALPRQADCEPPASRPHDPDCFCEGCRSSARGVSDSLMFIHGNNCGQKSAVLPDYHPESPNYNRARALRNELDEWELFSNSNSEVGAVLRSLGHVEASEKLQGCGAWRLYRSWLHTGHCSLREANFCSQLRGCRGCAKAWAAKAVSVYAAKSLALMDQAWEAGFNIPVPRLVTLTVKTGPHFKTQFNSMVDALKKLRQFRYDCRRRALHSEWSRPEHFAWAIECKRSSANSSHWHVHAHGVSLCSAKLDLDRLHSEWTNISGATARPNVKLFDSARPLLQSPDAIKMDSVRSLVRSDLKEVFKYPLKFNELSAADIAEVYLNTRKRRMRFGWDGFNGVEVPDDLRDLSVEEGPFDDLFFDLSLIHISEPTRPY